MTLVSNQVSTQDLFGMLEHQLNLTEKQGTAIRFLFEGMKKMNDEMSEKEARVDEKVEDMQMMVQEVRDSVTLTDQECYQMQQAVKLKTNELTKHRYKESDMKFNQMVGKYRRLIWSKMKERFEVAKYSHIRRIDFADAIEFVQNFLPEDYL
ncbi:ABC transporter permease [Paenibacillus sp. VTT E-133280]|uniref:ORF6C domain-containing protein n=1 Tax=Paenibacillus sp. VTT E-133280 TaxID=1986222 RepID=UPI000BA00101|nr:ORF6C domain-containing protein [Paenibacillus sp. VTT E-133280]OZQ66105.1 ABC transporter permease [Paenibacillus sp. VTT E-133280]